MQTSLFFQAALTADALSCSSHWAYQRRGLFSLSSPGSSTAGDNTPASLDPDATDTRSEPADRRQPSHLGEQMTWLQQSLDETGSYDTEHWRRRWLEGMRAYRGHIDAASSCTLEHDGLWPSRSDDIGGAARIAPLLDLELSVEETIHAARCQSALTHGDPAVADTAEFFVRATCAIRSGIDLSEALFLAAASGNYQQLAAGDLLADALSTDPDDLQATARDLGTLGGIHEAFPLTLYLAERPASDFRSLVMDNARVGGETSARAMLLALLFAARDGTALLDEELFDSIPQRGTATGRDKANDLARTA